MREPVAGINPQVLVWARERSGQTIDQVAKALHKEPEVIVSWEAGSSSPTYAQLETLAYKVYKRPVALFFFPEPPEEIDPEHSFRTLPEFEIEELTSDTRYKIRDARAMQIALNELNGGVNPAPRKIFRDIRVRFPLSALTIAREVRSYLGVDLEAQKRGWRNVAEALKEWRNAVEECGVFVFKNSFKQEDVSGLCLYDPEFPVIYINNSTSGTRQIFTLFHELAHLLVQTNGVTKASDRYIDALSGEAKSIEVFCNQFAAAFLVPDADLRRRIRGGVPDDETVAALAEDYKVSREVVLRRFLDLGLITKSYYESKVAQWRRDYEGRPKRESGGDYYATKATYLGEKYLSLVFGRYYQGRISIQQLADFLNVRVSSVPGLEQFLLQKATA